MNNILNIFMCLFVLIGQVLEIENKEDVVSSEKAGFKCLTFFWQTNITCQFPGKSNKIYQLSFKTPLNSRLQDCSLLKNGSYYSFTISHATHNYQYAHDILIFSLESDNQTDIINIEIYGSFIPMTPLAIIANNITDHSASVQWTIPPQMKTHRIIKLISRIDVCLEYCFNCKRFTNNHTTNNILLDSSILKYANAKYCVKVSSRSVIAADTEEMWSNYQNTTFKTLPRIPEKSPDVDIGAFFVDKKNITIYWRELAREEQNGNDFKYTVQEINDSKVFQTGKNFAEFQNMTDREHKFKIKSVNKVGESYNSSIIRTPNIKELLVMPTNFSVRIKDNKEYYISWNHRDPTIESFTVFWCQSNSHHWCENSFDFKTVRSKNYTISIIPKNSSNYNFAVSANTKNYSSGMLRAQCVTVDSYEIVSLLNFSVSHITAFEMTVNWSVECQYRAFVAYYILEYCSCDEKNCNTSCQFKEIQDGSSAKIDKLIPFTTYQITMSLMSVLGKKGLFKKHSITTLESAPEKVQYLHVTNIQNTSISLGWKGPLQTHGKLLNYTICYNRTCVKSTSTTQITLLDLKSFITYEIHVKACNARACSENNTLNVKTKIGLPGKVSEPHKSGVDGKSFGWNSSREKNGGCVHYYEIRQDIEQKNKKTDTSTIKILGNNYSPKINCQDEEIYKFYVRAVNVDAISHYHNISVPKECKLYKDIKDIESLPTKYYGEWSEPKLESCGVSKTEVWSGLIVSALICGFVLLIILIAIIFIRMKNLNAKIPIGIIDITSQGLPKKDKPAHGGKMTDNKQHKDEIELSTRKSESVMSYDSGISSCQISEVSHDEEINEPEAVLKEPQTINKLGIGSENMTCNGYVIRHVSTPQQLQANTKFSNYSTSFYTLSSSLVQQQQPNTIAALSSGYVSMQHTQPQSTDYAPNHTLLSTASPSLPLLHSHLSSKITIENNGYVKPHNLQQSQSNGYVPNNHIISQSSSFHRQPNKTPIVESVMPPLPQQSLSNGYVPYQTSNNFNMKPAEIDYLAGSKLSRINEDCASEKDEKENDTVYQTNENTMFSVLNGNGNVFLHSNLPKADQLMSMPPVSSNGYVLETALNKLK